MHRLQPGEPWRPITPDDPMYRKKLERTGIFRLALDPIDGREKLVQGKSDAAIDRVVAHLRRRGQPGDVAAIEAILTARGKAL